MPGDPTCHQQVLLRFQLAAHTCIHSQTLTIQLLRPLRSGSARQVLGDPFAARRIVSSRPKCVKSTASQPATQSSTTHDSQTPKLRANDGHSQRAGRPSSPYRHNVRMLIINKKDAIRGVRDNFMNKPQRSHTHIQPHIHMRQRTLPPHKTLLCSAGMTD